MSYQPLDLTLNQFRLLHFDSSNYPLQWKILKASLDDNIKYEALSYRWGDEGSDEAIMIDGELTTVTRNLSMALADIQQHLAGSPLWVDALCIDQNNVLERNHQVQKMADIYQKASRVHAWLGRPDGRNPCFVSFLYSLGNILDGMGYWAAGDRETENFLTAIHERKYEAKWVSLAAGTELPYWNRLWIVQEIGLASDLVVHYGSTFINWGIFARVRKALAKIYAGFRCPRWFRPIAMTILRSIPAQIEEQRDSQQRPVWLETSYMYLWIYIEITKRISQDNHQPLLAQGDRYQETVLQDNHRRRLNRLQNNSPNTVWVAERNTGVCANPHEISTNSWISTLEEGFKGLPAGIEHPPTPNHPEFDDGFLQQIKHVLHSLECPQLYLTAPDQCRTHPHLYLENALSSKTPSRPLRNFLQAVTEVPAQNINSSSASILFSLLYKIILERLRSVPSLLKQHRRGQPLPLKLHNLIETTERSQCREPRDKIYGLLGLSSNVRRGTVIIDYMRPMFKVYEDVLRHTYNSNKGCAMKLLLPRFSQLLQRSLGGPFSHTNSIIGGKHDESSHHVPKYMLQIVGFAQGSILPLEPTGLEPTAFSTYEERVRTLDDILGRRPKTSTSTRGINLALDQLLEADADALTPLQTETCYATRTVEALYDPGELEPGFTRRRYSPHPRLFSEGSGLIGLAPSTVREDDILCLFASCDIALIIRHINDHFRLVGRAVVARSTCDKRRRVSKSSLELFKYHVPRESLLKEKQPLYFYLDAPTLQALTFPVNPNSRRDYDFDGIFA